MLFPSLDECLLGTPVGNLHIAKPTLRLDKQYNSNYSEGLAFILETCHKQEMQVLFTIVYFPIW